eukprot:Rmarinus@m.1962
MLPSRETLPSRKKSLFLVFYAGLQIVCLSGVIFGWPALEHILREDGEFLELCDDDEEEDDDGYACDDQKLRLQLIFTVAASVCLAGALLNGYILDKFGPRKCQLFGLILSVIGILLLAVSDSKEFDAFLPGLSLLGLGGPTVQTSAFHLCNLFPSQKALVICLLTGSYQFSFMVFLVFQLMWEADIPREDILLGYAVLCSIFFIISAGLWDDVPYVEDRRASEIVEGQASVCVVHVDGSIDMRYLPPDFSGTDCASSTSTPRNSLPTTRSPVKIASSDSGSPQDFASTIPCLHAQHNRDSLPRSKPCSTSVCGAHAPTCGCNHAVNQPLGDPDRQALLTKQLMSLDFWLILAFFGIGSLWITFYLGTVDSQVREKEGGGRADSTYDDYMIAFNVINPCTALFVPFIGRFIDKVGFLLAAVATCVVGALFAGGAILDQLSPQIGTFLLFGLYNTALFPVMFSYVTERFGFTNFGMLSGVLFLISGLFNLLAYPLNWIVTDHMDSDYTVMNLCVVASMLASVFLPYLLHWRGERMRESCQLESAGGVAYDLLVPSEEEPPR